MARVWIARTYPDGDKIELVVFAEDTYPDALDQCRAVAVRGLAEACGVVIGDYAPVELPEPEAD